MLQIYRSDTVQRATLLHEYDHYFTPGEALVNMSGCHILDSRLNTEPAGDGTISDPSTEQFYPQIVNHSFK